MKGTKHIVATMLIHISHEKGLKNINQSTSLLAPGVGMNIRTLNQMRRTFWNIKYLCEDDLEIEVTQKRRWWTYDQKPRLLTILANCRWQWYPLCLVLSNHTNLSKIHWESFQTKDHLQSPKRQLKSSLMIVNDSKHHREIHQSIRLRKLVFCLVIVMCLKVWPLWHIQKVGST